MRFVVFTAVAGIIGIAPVTQEPMFLYAISALTPNGGGRPAATDISPGLKQKLATEILPVARDYWRKQKLDCNEDFTPLAAASASFTAPHELQTAVLYRYCIYGHNFAANGIAVFDHGLPIAHAVYRASWDSGIVARPELDPAGLSPFLVISGGTNMGDTWQIIVLLQFSGTGLHNFGSTGTYDDDCDGSGNVRHRTAYRIFVNTGSFFPLFREPYTAPCSSPEHWTKSGTLEHIEWDANETAYTLLPASRR
jgi:hypothetical protein